MKVGPINACVNGESAYAGRAYLFRGDVYYRYDWGTDRAAKEYPLPLARWKLPGLFGKGIDAALSGAGDYAGNAYFFKGPQYVRYSWKDDAAAGDSPKSIGAWGLSGSFAIGVDAAVNGEGPFAGKVLFIKGAQFVVYSWKDDTVVEKPKPLSALNFPGLFAVSVDAALAGYGRYAGGAYFFRGDKYIRYEWESGAVDKNYPLPIAGNWAHLAEVLALDPMRASFFNTWIGMARLNQQRFNIPWEVTLAQCAIESGWARAAPGNNAFGVKAGTSWAGGKQLLKTREVLDRDNHSFHKIYSITPKEVGDPPRTVYEYVVDDWFRSYASIEDSFRDHATFLQGNQFRAAVGRTDPFQYARAVADAGYATAPNYFDALSSTIRLLQAIQKVVE